MQPQPAVHASDPQAKYADELRFWSWMLERYVRWYRGEETLNGVRRPPTPDPLDRSVVEAATTTFCELFQETKYVTDLSLHPLALAGLKVLDVGCGPFASLQAFADCDRHGIDPLIDAYRSLGYPLDAWARRGFTYHCAPAEAMPFEDASFDAVVSVNAIDHVDDFAATAAEIRRVLRPHGVFRMHVHYHEATSTEPLELDDDVFLAHYGWVEGLEKLATAQIKDSGLTHAAPEELYVLWGNS